MDKRRKKIKKNKVNSVHNFRRVTHFWMCMLETQLGYQCHYCDQYHQYPCCQCHQCDQSHQWNHCDKCYQCHRRIIVTCGISIIVVTSVTIGISVTNFFSIATVILFISVITNYLFNTHFKSLNYNNREYIFSKYFKEEVQDLRSLYKSLSLSVLSPP